MGKVLPLLIMILLTIASAAGYLVLDKIISAGEIRIAEGQRQLEEGQSSMEEGKVALLAGKRDLSEGKKKYAEAEDSLFLKWAGSPWGENVAENWLFGISPEGIGVIGMLLNFTVAIIVSHLTSPPPERIQHLVEHIRVPRATD